MHGSLMLKDMLTPVDLILICDKAVMAANNELCS